jgi:WXG100 family type VII secretion target
MIVESVDGTPIRVPVDLEDAGTTINTQAGVIADELQALWQQLDALPYTWTGQASANYQQLQTDWNIAAAGLFSPDGVLGQIANAMNVSWGNYAEAEASNSKSWVPTSG